MSRFLRTLAKVGLVELEGGETPREAPMDDAEVQRILAEERAAQPQTAPEPPPLPPQVEKHVAVSEGVSFEDLYRSVQVPPSPFPAERLLKLLDGLRAMDPATRKAAVLAMDAADDAWTIDDALLDAERKTGALRSGVAGLEQNLQQQEAHVQGELAALDGYAQKAADTIRKQIHELEQLLQQELEAAAQKKAQVTADLRIAREACARERTRYEQEIARLNEVQSIFGTTR